MKELQDLLRYGEVAAALKVRETTVKSWTRRGKLPFVKLGPRTIRFRPEDINIFVNDRASQKE